ncbi:MAG: hypothetical protein SPE84_05975 [Bullifex sp.]|nr:hypothetical protein [Bullifex sp.]
MVKKIMVTAVVLLLAVTSVFAAPLRFVFGDLGQHPEILMGFLPSYLLAGAGYRPVELIEGDVTEIQLLAGLGYNQRKVWQDYLSGEVKKEDPIVYDVLETDWILRFVQGFGDSSVAGKALFTITAGYEGKLEFALDSMVKGQTRNNGIQSVIRSLDDRIGTYDGDIYPDLRGNRTALGSVLALQLKYDEMDDRMTTTDGFVAKADLKWAPSFLNGALDGKADYYSLTLNAVAAKTVFAYSENGKDMFTITLVDRGNVNWTDGSMVPVWAQGPVSLGRKVRGFNTWTYNTQFTAVNNFDVRFAGPNLGVKGIFPRVNLFYDIGYGCGKYFNTQISEGNFLMSTGVQVTVSFFDFIDLGYQVAYLFNGEKFSEGTKKVVGSFTFFLDF